MSHMLSRFIENFVAKQFYVFYFALLTEKIRKSVRDFINLFMAAKLQITCTNLT